MKRGRWVSPAVAVALLSVALDARAWIYPEHRDIAGAAISQLPASTRLLLDQLWTEARIGGEKRLCPGPWEANQGTSVACLDFAAWPAIGGDHSCSPDELLATVLDTPWILGVARIGAEAKVALATATSEDQARNRMVRADLDLQRTDRAYASRAGGSTAHFLLARTGDDLEEYLRQCTAAGADANALGLWARAQLAAEEVARRLAAGLPEADRPSAARRALALEAFALHFLEDAFAAGHVAGSWGDVATRKGTHDYYNSRGLDTSTWGREPVVLHGDAAMRPAERERAARTVRESLERFLRAADPGSTSGGGAESPANPATSATPATPGAAISCCGATRNPAPLEPSAGDAKDLARILRDAPIPTRGAKDVALPRFRAEIGPFLGLAGGFRGSFARDPSLEGGSSSWGGVGSLDIGLRAGLGLDALIGRAGDGQIFVGVGLLYQAARKSTCDTCSIQGLDTGSLLPTIPARTGVSLRLRVPFWLIPGDLLLAAPILALVSPTALEKMAITAVNGGLIPWQTGLATPIGRVQFVLGREVGVTFFGYVGGEDLFLYPVPVDGGIELFPVSVRSIDVDIPILEIRPFRDFGHRQTTALLLQLGVGADIPTSLKVWDNGRFYDATGTPAWYGYIKVAFDWRSYL